MREASLGRSVAPFRCQPHFSAVDPRPDLHEIIPGNPCPTGTPECRVAQHEGCGHARNRAAGSRRALAMTLQDTAVLVLIVLWLNGCALLPQSYISVDGSPVTELSRVAQVSEDSKQPLLLRGLDRVPLDTLRTPSALNRYVYVMKAGRHTLWVMSMPYGHPLIPQRIRCYVIDMELVEGVRYRLEDDPDEKRALVLRDDTGERVALGRMVDEAWVFQRSCRWE